MITRGGIINLSIVGLVLTVAPAYSGPLDEQAAGSKPVSTAHGPVSAATIKNKGIPPAVSKLMQNFAAEREQFFEQQEQFRRQLALAHAEDRVAIRQQAQANRQAFLARMATYRHQLKNELRARKIHVTPAELRQLVPRDTE